MKNRKVVFSAVIAMIVMGVSVFYACKKDTLQNGQSEKNMMSSTGNTQTIDIHTYINIGATTYPVTGSATASHIDGRIYGCNLTWTIPLNEANVVGMHFVATLKPEFEDLAEVVDPIMEHYNITINEKSMGADGVTLELTAGQMVTISYHSIVGLWERMVEYISPLIGAKHVCCSATCSKGSCKAYSTPCNCSCMSNGYAKCGGGFGVSDGIVDVFCSEYQLATHEPYAIFLTEQLNRTDIAKVVLKIKNLFEINENPYIYIDQDEDGFGIEDVKYIIKKENIAKYYEYLEILDDFYEKQPEDIKKIIMEH